MKTRAELQQHVADFRQSGHRPCPPGEEIYRSDGLSVWEIDGRRHRVYCQNLCLVTTLFLETKTLFYGVDAFLFYVLTEWTDKGATILGCVVVRPISLFSTTCFSVSFSLSLSSLSFSLSHTHTLSHSLSLSVCVCVCVCVSIRSLSPSAHHSVANVLSRTLCTLVMMQVLFQGKEVIAQLQFVVHSRISTPSPPRVRRVLDRLQLSPLSPRRQVWHSGEAAVRPRSPHVSQVSDIRMLCQ